MADSNTPNLNLIKPEVGGSSDTWGGKLNDNMDAIDQLFLNGPVLSVEHGGTGADTPDKARENLGAAATTHTHPPSQIPGLGGLATRDTVGSAQIEDGSVTNADLANMASGTFKGRMSANAGPPEDIPIDTLRSVLNVVPTGAVIPFAGANAPTGWLLCAGQAVSRATYADLYVAIGTTYGGGDGTSTFNLPDLRGRVAAGKDDMGGGSTGRLRAGGVNGTILGASGGADAHALHVDEMPDHRHTMAADVTTSTSSPNLVAGQFIAKRNDSSSNQTYDFMGSTKDATVGLSGAAGKSGAHNNVQPTIVLNYIIKV